MSLNCTNMGARFAYQQFTNSQNCHDKFQQDIPFVQNMVIGHEQGCKPLKWDYCSALSTWASFSKMLPGVNQEAVK